MLALRHGLAIGYVRDSAPQAASPNLTGRSLLGVGISPELGSPELIVISKKGCPACADALAAFNRIRVPIRVIDVARFKSPVADAPFPVPITVVADTSGTIIFSQYGWSNDPAAVEEPVAMLLHASKGNSSSGGKKHETTNTP